MPHVLFMPNYITNSDLGTSYFHCFGMSVLFQLTEQGDVCVHVCVCVYTYICLFSCDLPS